METVRSPKRRFGIVLNDAKSQKTSLINTAMTACQKTAFLKF
jgi:hypothetical protein